jgi:hypothetical protein
LNEEISEVSGPMVLGDGGWQLVLPEHTSSMVEEALSGKR